MSSTPGRPATFDQNTWYQLSEGRVDTGGQRLNKNLVVVGPPRGLEILDNDSSWWQFLDASSSDDDGDAAAVPNNRYQMRTIRAGAQFRLSVCFVGEELHPAKTRLCMAPADADADEQKWEAFHWDDGTTGYRFVNVRNGTDWWLDVHKGNPPFMNNDTDTSVLKPAQRWFVSSVSAVDDPVFAVGGGGATPAPDSTGPESNPAQTTADDGALGGAETDSSSSSSISTAAAAGIGVGCAAVVVACLAFFFLYRRKQKKVLKEARDANAAATAQLQQWQQRQQEKDDKRLLVTSESPIEAPATEPRYEVPANQIRHELESTTQPPSNPHYTMSR